MLTKASGLAMLRGVPPLPMPGLVQMLGYSPEEMEGRQCIDFVYEGDRERISPQLQRRQAGLADTYEVGPA